ncbi:MAG: NAD-dependent succinate-semialdehyde dehydrogenase [Sphingobium sp.]
MSLADPVERARLALRRPALLREAAFVGGEWVGGDAGIAVINPATGRTLGHVPDLGRGGAEAAIAAAAAAQPAWAARPARERGLLLRRWAELILDNRDDLARLMTAEQGKPLAEATGEVAYAAAFVEWFAEEGRRTYGDVIPGHLANARIRVEKRPVGVVAAITPWNFPAAMVTRKAAPALAAGCAVVLKPSELTPFSALALAALAEEAGLPTGLLNIVTGAPAPIGDAMVEDPRVAKFSFTGSTAVGRMLGGRAMGNVKRVSLELGGNAPFLVFDDADLDIAVEGAMLSKFRNAGQTCVCANRFLVQAGIHDAFAARLADRADALGCGDGLAGTPEQGPLIDARAVAKAMAHVRDALDGGGRLLAGGVIVDDIFVRPTVITGVSPDALLCREETFGPVAGIVRFESEAEAVALANAGSAGLAAYLFTRDADRAIRVPEALRYGMVGINTGLISSEVAPFGGCRQSGIGREGSRYGIAEFLELQTIVQAVGNA